MWCAPGFRDGKSSTAIMNDRIPIQTVIATHSLAHGWRQVTLRLDSPRFPLLEPGQWLTHPRTPLAFLSQPDAQTLQLILPESPLPDSLHELQIEGQPLSFPDEAPFILVGHGLSGLGGILAALRQRPYLPHCKGVLLNLSDLDTLPFQPVPSRFWSPDLPADMIATLPLIEDWGWPARLIHPHMPGCGEYDWQSLREQFPQDWVMLETGVPVEERKA